MADNKTQPTGEDVKAFINGLGDERKRIDCLEVMQMMEALSGERAKMWGPAIVGFGTYHYKYDSGREGDFLRIGFSPRKANLTLYIMGGFPRYHDLMQRLGKYKTGKSCLYIKSLNDINLEVLKELMKASLDYMEKRYGKP